MMARHLLHLASSLTLAGLALAPLAGCGETACDPEAPGTICTVAGTGEQGFSGEGALAIDAALYYPQDTVIAPNGDMWISDFNNYLMRSVDTEGIIRSEVGTGLIGDSPQPEDGATPALSSAFNHSPHIVFTPDGEYLYIAAWHNSRIKRLRMDDMMVENVAGTGARTFYTGDDGPATEADLDLPSGIALSPEGNVVIMDQANQVIRMIDEGGMIHRIAGSCVIDYGTPCADGVEPVACPGTNKSTCGDPEVYCQEACSPGYGGDGGPALEMRMNQPFGQMAYPGGRLAYDGAGNLYFTDSGNNRIRMIDGDGMVHTVVGTGEGGYSGDGGPATEAEINQPIDLEIAADGSIYFTDTLNNCIRMVDPAGTISTIAGRCNPDANPDDGLDHFSGDGGAPTEAELNWPFGLDLVGDKLYVSDTYNNRIRVVNL